MYRSPQMVVDCEGILPKMAKTFRLRIKKKFPRSIHPLIGNSWKMAVFSVILGLGCECDQHSVNSKTRWKLDFRPRNWFRERWRNLKIHTSSCVLQSSQAWKIDDREAVMEDEVTIRWYQYGIMSYRIVSLHIIAYWIISCYVISYHSIYHMLWCFIIFVHMTSCYHNRYESMISIYSIPQSFIKVVSAKVLQIREGWSISLSLRAPFINSNCWFWEHPKH